MPSKLTVYDLEHVTDYRGFESFCNDLMSREGYKSIQPLGGSKDKGRDAIHFDKSAGVATVFAYSVRTDWESKLEEDLETVRKHGHECQRFLFVTTAVVSPPTFDEKKTTVKGEYGWEFDLFDLNRVATLIDNHYRDLVDRHPNIFPLSSIGPQLSSQPFDRRQYAASLLRTYEIWVKQYTPLLAEHKELDTFVDLHDNEDSTTRVPVADVPAASQVSVLLGESGAGKTMSLWKIAVQACERLSWGAAASPIPALFDLRSWSSDRKCRDLLQERFDLFEVHRDTVRKELLTGSFLILMDGINEVPQGNLSNCCYDVVNFIGSFPANKYIISCRSSDFRPTLLPTKDVKPPVQDPDIYEICRLEREQIRRYCEAYGTQHGILMTEFLDRIHIDKDDEWNDHTSTLQLARIPLYLQIFLDTFRRTNQLPTTRAQLLRGLVDRILDREDDRGDRDIDKFSIEHVLGYLSFHAALDGDSLRLEESYAREMILRAFEHLRSNGFVSPNVRLGDVWRRLLSANFLKLKGRGAVEWIHQVLRDYFLGTECARIWRNSDSPLVEQVKIRLGYPSWDLVCTITLSILGEQHGSSFLAHLVECHEENARRAFEGQDSSTRSRMLTSIVRETLLLGDPETKVLRRLCCALPYVEVVETLDANFHDAGEEMSVVLIEAIAQLLVEHLPHVAAGIATFPLWTSDASVRETHYQTTKAATKRGADVLRKYLRNKNEAVSFFAAKGLWETDRPAAIAQLTKLRSSSNQRIRSLVEDLVDEWGID